MVGAGTTWLGRKFATPLPQQRKLGFALVGLGSPSTNQLAPGLQKAAYESAGTGRTVTCGPDFDPG